MTNRKLTLFALLIVFFTAQTFSLSFVLLPDTLGVSVMKKLTGTWEPATSRMEISFGDSVAIDSSYKATIMIESGSKILIDDECRLFLGGDNRNLVLSFKKGLLMLKRVEPHSLDTVVVEMKECTMVPMGTVAVMKYTKTGDPTVAVIDGQVGLRPSSGAPVVVQAGQYATYNPAEGNIKTGELKPDAIASLEKWSGLAASASPTTDSTPEDSAQPVNSPIASNPPTATPIQPPPPAKPPVAPPAQAPKSPAPSQDSTPKTPIEKPEENTPAGVGKIAWEISAGNVTVDGKQWTRIAISPDIPIWKFGICLDLELFITEQGEFSDKGWSSDDWVETLSRKIRYVRFGQESDPLFVKIGGLSSVTLGYGFIMDRFTNMMYYPDQKYLGLQLYLNDITPLGITLQTITPNLREFSKDGGVFGVRLGLKPLKSTPIPILKNMSAAGSFVADLNQYAPARQWSFPLNGGKWDRDEDNLTDSTYLRSVYGSKPYYDQLIADHKAMKDYDYSVQNPDQWAADTTSSFSIFGGDVGVPLISSSLLSLDIYGQAAMRSDNADVKGWGFGAPGLALKIPLLTARIEYRHVTGRFTPGYFGPYYENERLVRHPAIMTKEQSLGETNLDGVFGTAGITLGEFLMVNGSYQIMAGKNETRDQRYEASAGIGQAILERIPKLSKAEGYLYKTNVGRTRMKDNKWDSFAQPTPGMYFGYRAKIDIAAGASLIWDMRYGWDFDETRDLVPNNSMTVQTAVSF